MKLSDETKKLVEKMMKEAGVSHRKANEIKQVLNQKAVLFELEHGTLLPYCGICWFLADSNGGWNMNLLQGLSQGRLPSPVLPPPCEVMSMQKTRIPAKTVDRGKKSAARIALDAAIEVV
jgi:hypothetical protein